MKISWTLLWLLCLPTEASRRVSEICANSSPKVERESDEALAVQSGGSCVALSGFALGGAEALAVENDPTSLVPILSLTLKVKDGKLQMNRRSALQKAIYVVGNTVKNMGDAALAWSLPDLEDSSLVMKGSLSDLNDFLPSVEYCSSADPKALVPDKLRVILSDNGFCRGLSEETLSATLEVPVSVLPVVDSGKLYFSKNSIELVTHSAQTALQYTPGAANEVECTLELKYNDGLLLGIDYQGGMLFKATNSLSHSTLNARAEVLVPSSGLIVRFGGELSKRQVTSFKFVRNVCPIDEICSQMQSTSLNEESSDEEILAASQKLAIYSEDITDLQVIRYPVSRLWLIWNIPNTFGEKLAVSTPSQVSVQMVRRRFHFQGKSEQVATLLKTLNVYSLVGGMQSYNRLEAVMSTSDTGIIGDSAVLSAQLDIFSASVLENIELKYPLDLAFDDNRAASLNNVSLRFPPTYAPSTSLKWTIQSTLGSISWSPSSISPAVVSQQMSNRELELRGGLVDLKSALSKVRVDVSNVQGASYITSYDDQTYALLALSLSQSVSIQTLMTSPTAIISAGADLFQLRVQNRVTSPLNSCADASTVENAIRDLVIDNLVVSVKRKTSPFDSKRFDYTIVLSAPVAIYLDLVVTGTAPLSKALFQSFHVSPGKENQIAFATISMSLKSPDSPLLIASEEIHARVNRLRKKLGIRLPASYFQVNFNHTLMIEGIEFEGYAQELTFSVSCSKGTIGLLPKHPPESHLSKPNMNSTIEISGHFSSLRTALEHNRLMYSPMGNSSGYDKLVIIVSSADDQASEVLPIMIKLPLKPPSVSLPVSLISVFKNESVRIEEVQLTHDPEEPHKVNSLGITLNITTFKGELELASHRLYHHSTKSVQIKGDVDNINAALKGLQYHAPARESTDDHILFSTQWIADSGAQLPPSTFTLPIEITRRPVTVSLLINDSFVDDRSLLTTKMDIPASLEVLSLHVDDDSHGWTSCNDPVATNDCNITIQLSLFAAHGLLTDSADLKLQAEQSLDNFIGNAAQANMHLQRQLYSPDPKFHGSDQIVINVKHKFEVGEMAEEIILLPVHVMPDCERPQLFWAITGSSALDFRSSSRSSFALPELLLTREGLNKGFCEDDVRFRVSLTTNRGFLTAKAISAASLNDRLGFTFEGRLWDLNLALASVEYQFEIRYDVPTPITSIIEVQVYEQDDLATVVSSASLRLKFAGDMRPPDILVNETLTVSEDTDVMIGELINLEAFADLEDDCSVRTSSPNGAIYAAAGEIYIKASSDQQISVKVLRSVISNLHYVPNHNFNGIDEINFKVQDRGSILYVFVQPENDPPMLVFINSGETKDWYTYPRMFLPTFQLVDPDDKDTFQVEIRVENGSFVIDQVYSSSWDGITMELSASATSLRLTSRIKRLNTVFLQRLIEVMALPCTYDGAIEKNCAVLITLCVDDGAESVCEELRIPEQDHIMVSNLTSSLDTGADGSVKISQAFDEMPLLSNQSFVVNGTKERTAERISAVRVITNETWFTQHGSYTNLTSLLGVSIDADPSRSHINEVGDDVLDLNISCLHCSWRYHEFVPKVSYEFAQTRGSMLRFLGGQASLNKVFATLEIAITSNSSSGSESIHFQLAPTLPRLASDTGSVWKDSTDISVPFTVLPSPHVWQAQRTRIFDSAVSANVQLSAFPQQTETTLGPRNTSMVIVAEQGKAQLIGDLLIFTGSQEDPTWFRINARVANGKLSIPLHVCCVNIRETKHESELDVVGPAHALQNAIAASQFQGNDLFSGKDMLKVTISHFDSDTNRPNISFNIPVDVVAVHQISSAQHQNSDILLFEEQVYDPAESAIDAALLFDDTGDENVADHRERILPLPHQKVINTFRGTEPTAVMPLIHIEETIEGPFSTQYWQTITLALEVGKSWRIQGVSVRDGSGQPLLHDEDLILGLSVDIGALLLSVWDGLDMIVGRDRIFTTAISVVGKMDRLNAALKTFHYQCTDICNQQATITLHVRNPHASLPGGFHKRIIHIDHTPLETSKTSSEDVTFRFPDLARIEVWDFVSSDPMANTPVNAPRITVPQVYEGLFHAIMDYVFLPRLVCLPLMCDEDTPLTLDGISVTQVGVTLNRPPTTNLLELTVSVSHGVITLGSTLRANCIVKFTGIQSSKRVSFKATVGCINRILNTMTYIGEPNFSGSDQLKIRVEHTWGLDVAFDEALVPIVVAAINDAPYIDVASVFYEADEDIPLLIDDLRLRDPDTKDKPIRVTMEAGYGYLVVLRHNGVKMTTDTIDGASSEGTKVTLEGTLWDVNAAITSIAYTSAKDWNSLQFHSDDTGTTMNGFDTITIRSTDFSPFNESSESVLYVYVEPAPDSVVISIPTNNEISIYANDVPGQLHGDEDTWIRVNGLAFSSVDDTSRMILIVSMTVGHGVLTSSDFRGLTFLEGTVNKDSLLKFQGNFANVNGFVSRLRYLPHKDFYGSDSLVVNAQAVDEYTQQHTSSSSIDVSITVDPVNDAPVWNIGSTTVREVQQGQAAIIGGIYFQDVDVHSLNCVVESCVMDLIVEASNGFVTIPDFISPSFSNNLSTKNVAYVAISGTPDELNRALAELTFNIAEPEYYRADSPSRHDIKLQLTIDDRGTFGRGGPHVSATTIVLSPITWSSYDFSVAVPDNVLTLDEDTIFTFNGDLQLVDPDASRSFQNLLELTITCPHGTFALSSKSTGVQVLQNHSDDSTKIRGYFTQLNMALNGSFYVPLANWYGSEHLSLSLAGSNHLEKPREGAVASIFLFVAPVCDEPQWKNRLLMSEPLEVKEDGYLLVDSIQLTNPDLDDEQREVEISISVNHGGIMLALTRGLLIQHAEYSTTEDRLIAQHAAVLNSYFESRLFFKYLHFRGRVADINAALEGMIFKPWLDYNSGGWPVDEISFAATSVCDTSEPRKSAITIRIAVTAVNDPPILISQHFQPVPLVYYSGDLRAAALHSSVEAVEDLPQPLDPVELYDPDFDPDSNDLRLLVNISCIHCTVTSKRLSASSDAQASDDLIIVTRNWRNEEGVQLIVHGNLQSLNDNLMNQLVFEGAVNFNGNAFVLIEISDLGNYGEGGEQRVLFVSCVNVRPANDVPEIHLPRYQSQKTLLQLDENSSVLIQGAPSLSAALPALAATRYNLTWNVMCANLQASDASTRLHSLFHSSVPERSAPSFLVSHKGALLFSAWNSDLGQELWHSDGTAAGTVPLKDIFPGGGDSNPTSLTPFSVDNRVYFAAKGPHLSWVLDNDYQDACQSYRPSSLDSNIYFAVAAQNTWDADETYDCPVGFRWMSTSEAQEVFIGKIALEGHSEEHFTYFDQCGWRGYEWGGQIRKYFRFSDSKTTGAFKHAGFRDSYRIDIGFQVDLFAGIVCYRESPAYQVTWGTQLWATDGTTTGTQRIARISTDPEGSNPSHFAEMNQRLYFQARSTDYGSELWSTDGTRDGTYLVADVEFGSRSSEPRFLIAFDSLVFFTANTQDYGRELWFSDGNRRFDFSGDQHATVGTGLVFDICLGPKSSSPQHLTVLSAMGSSLLLFQADDCVHGPELWSTDGTQTGTKLILDIHEGTDGSFPAYLTSFEGKVYFQADDGIHGAELWTTDGSSSGTVMLTDIATGVLGSRPSFLTVLDGINDPLEVLVFTAQAERDHLTEFWRSDGTAAGTTKLFPESHEVVEVNKDSLNLQLVGHQLVTISSRPASFFFLGRESSHKSGSQRKIVGSPSVDIAQTRSITLQDTESLVHDRELTVSLNCSKGWLSLGQQCDGVSLYFEDATNMEKPAVFTLKGSLNALNCAVEKVTYHSKPHVSGIDEIHVTLSQDAASSEENGSSVLIGNVERDSSYTVSKRLLVEIRAINDPPTISMSSIFYAPLKQWVVLNGITIDDPDAEEGKLYVSISVHSGRLRVTSIYPFSANGPAILHPVVDHDALKKLEFATTVEQSRFIFKALEYRCDDRYGCSNAQRDYITVQVDDNGFTGAHGPQVSTKTAEILVLDQSYA